MSKDFSQSELLSQPNNIEVRYRDILPSESLIQIDGERLTSTLQTIGFSNKSLKPITIQDGGNALELAGLDPIDRSLFINQDNIVRSLRTLYHDTLQNSNLEPETQYVQSLKERIQNSTLFKLAFIPQWSYHLIKDGPGRNFWPGDQDKVTDYFKRAHDGTLYPGLTPEQRDKRTQESIQRLVYMYADRMTSWVLAHELEHGNNLGSKSALKVIAAIGPIAIGTAILALYGQSMPEGAKVVDLVTGLLGTIPASVGAKLYDEQSSYTMADANFSKFTDAISINKEVFQKLILSK